MPLMSLRESLARSKDKWKKRLYFSRSVGPMLPPANNDNQPAALPLEVGSQPAKGTLSWPGVKTLLRALETASDTFGPLKSAINGLIKCIDIYERASQERKDCDELLKNLDGLLADLVVHMSQPMNSIMTSSVKLLCHAIEEEVKIIVNQHGRNAGYRLLEVMDTSEEIIGCYRRINGHLERLTLNANMSILKSVNGLTTEARLKGISPAMAAIYDSTESDDIKRGGCTPGTRQPQIDLLLEWARDPEAGKACWMNGMAGTGKTTIAYSVCTALEQASALGASFFCSRVIPECRQVKHIIPTIAYQLARYSLPFRCALDKVLELDPDARTRALRIQYQKLIVEPLLEVQGSLPTDFIIIIDALDECENDSLGHILNLLLSPTTVLPIRFLVSSRPEPEINQLMTRQVDEQHRPRLVLHDLNADAVKTDIETYMRHELEHVPLTDSNWSGLIDRCGVLFIYASTACRLVKQGYETKTLNEAISVILTSASDSAHEDEHDIDELYSIILTSAFDKAKMRLANIRRTKEMLETVICAIEPITLDALASVLGLESTEQANALLQPLRSVINVTGAGLVTTLHSSFTDFMLSSARSGFFHCVATKRHTMLTESCLRLISASNPQFNICRLPSSYLVDSEVSDIDKRVGQCVSAGLVYTCRYWSTHLYLGDYDEKLVDAVRSFFYDRLLIWMEILNLTKNMRFGTSIIRNAEKWCYKKGISDNLYEIVRDAGRFVSVYANHPISQSTPHIYVSMLAFWPRSRPVSIAYVQKAAGILEPTGTAIARRQPALLATWRVSDKEVYSTSLSPDGSWIVAATEDAVDVLDTSTGDGVFHIQEPQARGVEAIITSPDGTQVAFAGGNGVYLVDVRSEAIQEISKPSTDVRSIAYSPDGSQLACGLLDGNIYIYPSQKGDPVLALIGHTGSARSIVFSPDGTFLASGSTDHSVRIWGTKSGHLSGKPLWGHTFSVLSVSYSPDGSRLASASSDTTIRVWDPLTGQTVLGPLKAHSHWVRSVTFSPDGAFIASGSSDRTIQVYDAQSGQAVLGPLEGHTRHVNSVIFSPDSTQLFSCADDGTIRLWNVQNSDDPSSSQQTFPSSFISTQYSPSGLRVASGSDDGSVYVWDIQTGEIALGPLYGHSEAVMAVDFSPNDAYIASASVDSTLRIWCAQGGYDLYGPLQGHTDMVNCVQFSPDGSLLVSGSDDATVRVWDVSSGQSVIEPFTGHSDTVLTVALSPNGALVVSGSDDLTIRVWDIKTGQTVIGPLQGHKERVTSVEFSPDGCQILSGSWDGSIRTWDAKSGQALLVWGDDQKDVNTASFSPDGLLVASGSLDNAIRIWDVQAGDLILSLEGHTSWVQSVRFSPDGSHVVSCSADRTIRFWGVSSRIMDLQINRSKRSNEVNMPTDPSKGPWSLDRSGWLVDRKQRRLVWVPDDLHNSVPQHANDFIICKQGSLKLDFDGVRIGRQWADCYQP